MRSNSSDYAVQWIANEPMTIATLIGVMVIVKLAGEGWRHRCLGKIWAVRDGRAWVDVQHG